MKELFEPSDELRDLIHHVYDPNDPVAKASRTGVPVVLEETTQVVPVDYMMDLMRPKGYISGDDLSKWNSEAKVKSFEIRWDEHYWITMNEMEIKHFGGMLKGESPSTFVRRLFGDPKEEECTEEEASNRDRYLNLKITETALDLSNLKPPSFSKDDVGRTIHQGTMDQIAFQDTKRISLKRVDQKPDVPEPEEDPLPEDTHTGFNHLKRQKHSEE